MCTVKIVKVVRKCLKFGKHYICHYQLLLYYGQAPRVTESTGPFLSFLGLSSMASHSAWHLGLVIMHETTMPV